MPTALLDQRVMVDPEPFLVLLIIGASGNSIRLPLSGEDRLTPILGDERLLYCWMISDSTPLVPEGCTNTYACPPPPRLASREAGKAVFRTLNYRIQIGSAHGDEM